MNNLITKVNNRILMGIEKFYWSISTGWKWLHWSIFVHVKVGPKYKIWRLKTENWSLTLSLRYQTAKIDVSEFIWLQHIMLLKGTNYHPQWDFGT